MNKHKTNYKNFINLKNNFEMKFLYKDFENVYINDYNINNEIFENKTIDMNDEKFKNEGEIENDEQFENNG